MTNYGATLPADMIRGPGLLLINSSTPYGASRGGLTFDPGKAVRNVDFDGKTNDVAELDVIDGYESVISGSFLPNPGAKAATLEPGSSSATADGITTVTPKAAGAPFAAGDYLTNVRLAFGKVGGGFMWVRFPKALVRKWSTKGAEKGETTHEIEIVARSLAANIDAAPFVIEEAAAL